MNNINHNPNNLEQENKKFSKKSIIIFIILLLVIVAGFFIYSYSRKSSSIAPVIDNEQALNNELAQYFQNQDLKTQANVLPPDDIRQRFEDAIDAYKQEIQDEEAQENGNPYSGYLGVANTYRTLGDFNQALDAYKIVIEKYPNDFLVWHNLGVLYEDMQQYLEAAKAYSKSIESKPVEQLAYLKLADLYVKFSNDPSQAQSVYLKALDETKNNIEVLKFYAIYLEDVLDERESAISIWQKVLEKDPNNQDVKNRITDLEKNLK